MNDNRIHTVYHPRWYRRNMPIFWWVRKRQYSQFILRELTSIFVAGYAIIYLFELRAISDGPEAYAIFLELLKSPISIIFHLVGLLFVVYHSITWFNLSPKALVVRIGGVRVPDKVIASMNYLAWIGLSAVLLWAALIR